MPTSSMRARRTIDVHERRAPVVDPLETPGPDPEHGSALGVLFEGRAVRHRRRPGSPRARRGRGRRSARRRSSTAAVTAISEDHRDSGRSTGGSSSSSDSGAVGRVGPAAVVEQPLDGHRDQAPQPLVLALPGPQRRRRRPARQPMQWCMPWPKLRPERRQPVGHGAGRGRTRRRSAPQTDGSRFTAMRSMTTLSPSCDLGAVVQGDVGERPPRARRAGRLEADRLLRCSAGRTSRSVTARSASSGWAAIQSRTLWVTRVNAVADVWAPASR